MVTERQMLVDFPCLRHLEHHTHRRRKKKGVATGLEEGEIGSHYSAGTDFPSSKMKEFQDLLYNHVHIAKHCVGQLKGYEEGRFHVMCFYHTHKWVGSTVMPIEGEEPEA